jgi:hypothetical protein
MALCVLAPLGRRDLAGQQMLGVQPDLYRLRQLHLFLCGEQRSLGDTFQVKADGIFSIDALGNSRTSCRHVGAPFVASAKQNASGSAKDSSTALKNP